jgi:hypothetical protein
MDIKQTRDKGLRAAYAISMVATVPVALMLGPVGSMSRSGVKSIYTTTVSIDSAYKRYHADQELIRKKEYQTVKNLYFELKDMYLVAQKTKDQEKMDTIAKVALSLFNISNEVFVGMLDTLAVEKDRVKLNLYQPIE